VRTFSQGIEDYYIIEMRFVHVAFECEVLEL